MTAKNPIHASEQDFDDLKSVLALLERDSAKDSETAESTTLHALELVDRDSNHRANVPSPLAEIIRESARTLLRGGAVAVLRYDAQLTTQQAADYLGVSRPYVISLLDSGKIPYTRLRSHRRIYVADLQAYRRQRDAERRRALAELSRTSYELGMYDLPEDSDSENDDEVRRSS